MARSTGALASKNGDGAIISLEPAATIGALVFMLAVAEIGLSAEGLGGAMGHCISGGTEIDVTATGNLSEVMTPESIAEAVWTRLAEDPMTAEQILRVLLAVAAGKSVIDPGPPVRVKFRDVLDTKDRVDAEMSGSERAAVSLDGE